MTNSIYPKIILKNQYSIFKLFFVFISICIDEMYSDKDSKGDIKAGLKDGKESEGGEKDVCTSLDRIMCGIVDDTDHGKES